jgi:hypothetical protein
MCLVLVSLICKFFLVWCVAVLKAFVLVGRAASTLLGGQSSWKQIFSMFFFFIYLFLSEVVIYLHG